MTPRLLHFDSIRDPSGSLTPFEWSSLPFPPARAFLIHDVDEGARRGGHAHHVLEELIVAVSGSFDVLTVGEGGPHHWTLNRASTGLYVPPGVWRSLQDFSGNAVALVLASTPYSPEDYIYDRAEFMASLPPVTDNPHDALFTMASQAYYDVLQRTGDRQAAADARTAVFATEKWTK